MVWEIIGWIGTAVVVFSMLQQRITRLRLINMIGCIISVAYNTAVGVWPMVALNAVLTVIQAYNLVVLWRGRHSTVTYSVVAVAPSDPIVAHVLETNREDIATYFPNYDGNADLGFLVMKGDEIVGIVLATRDHSEAELVLDYVTPAYRDFTPGEFVFASDEWAAHGVASVRTVPGGPDYYARVGFTATGGVWHKELSHSV